MAASSVALRRALVDRLSFGFDWGLGMAPSTTGGLVAVDRCSSEAAAAASVGVAGLAGCRGGGVGGRAAFAPAGDRSASRGPIPGPPAVGDCLLDPTVIASQALIGPAPKHPWLRTGPCQGRRFGEVAAVLTKHDLPAPTPSSSQPDTGPNSGNDTEVLDPYEPPCFDAVTVWVGPPSPAGPQIFDRWLTDSFTVGVVLSGPNQIQNAAGQDWVACIGAGINWGTAIPDAAGAIGHDAIGYDATIHGMFSPGPPPSTFALCTPTTDNQEPVACTTAHRVERFGAMNTEHAVTEADRRGCQTLVRHLTGMPDPTAGGKLTITVDDYAAPTGYHFLHCLIVTVSPHQLTGPLLGLADRPAPVS